MKTFIIFVFNDLRVNLLRVTTRIAPRCYTGLLRVTTQLRSRLLHKFCSQLLHGKFDRKKYQICGLNQLLVDLFVDLLVDEDTRQMASLKRGSSLLVLGTDSLTKSEKLT